MGHTLCLVAHLNSSLSRWGQFWAMAAMRCSNWIFREILSAVPIASTRRFWIRRSVDFSQDLVHLCKLTFVFGKHVMKSISVTWPIPVRTRPSSCCWWVSMNFLIEPSVTLSDLGLKIFRNNPRIRWNTSKNALSKLTRNTSHACHLSRSRHRMLALFPLPIHASITFYVIL